LRRCEKAKEGFLSRVGGVGLIAEAPLEKPAKPAVLCLLQLVN
jgi:hypothetical protein